MVAMAAVGLCAFLAAVEPPASSTASPAAEPPTASPVEPPTAAPAPTTPAGPAPGADERGRTLYLQGCVSCHGPQGEGSQRGPALVGVGAASVDFQLSTGRMPPTGRHVQPEHRTPAFSAQDIDALVRHVTAFGGDGPPVPAVEAGSVSRGRALYLANCAACHSATGAGGALTNGRTAPPLWRATPTQIVEAIRVGPGLMPAFPDTDLNRHDVDSIAAYVEVLQGHRGDVDRGGGSLWRMGPVSEGLVGWLVGLGLVVLVIRRLGTRASQ
jgi:ubiquinol-cytochrome c reductase cytochrome c subunit